MTLGGKRVCVAFPDTVLEEQDSVREKTSKLGQIARYCSIFGVDAIKVFHDPRGRGESSFIKKVLEYLETPQYLRRRLYPLSDDLRFAGLLPPIRMPSHRPKVPLDKVRPGEIREGVVLSDGRTVDLGLEQPANARQRLSPGKRLTLRVTSNPPLEVIPIERRQVPEYWGYTVETCQASVLLGDRDFPFKVATSRLGDPVAKVIRGMRQDLTKERGVMVIFGSPSRGLLEMLGKDVRSKVSFVVNLFPEQNVATVRSEEAVMAGLYLLALLSESALPEFA